MSQLPPPKAVVLTDKIKDADLLIENEVLFIDWLLVKKLEWVPYKCKHENPYLDK